MHQWRSAVVLMVLVLASGCGKPTPPTGTGEVEVKGRAEDASGKALGGVNLRFIAQEGGGKIRALTCRTQADGTFFLRTLPGTYKVTMSVASAPAVAKNAKPVPPRLPEGIPQEYGSAKDTPWEVEVPPGGKSDVVLAVRKP